MKSRIPVLAAVLVAGAGVVTLALARPWTTAPPAGEPGLRAGDRQESPSPFVSPVTRERQSEEPEVLTNQKVPIPMHVKSSLPPGTYVEIDELPEVERGLRLGDGSIVPYLNGMTWAPAIHRSPKYGPVPPVVGKTVDGDGFEWYVHADGSTTTTRYQKVELPDETYWDPYTGHAVPTPDRLIRFPAEEPDK